MSAIIYIYIDCIYNCMYNYMMKFDWDENKNAENIKNHDGFDFAFAAKVFNDVWAIEEDDLDHSTEDEKRYTIVGLVENTILRVSYAVVC